jgi:hypothetical protein
MSKPTQLNFSIIIDASPQTVWYKMLDLKTYTIWTAEFEPTSWYEGSWDQGSEIKFMSKDWSGMVGFIKENRLYEYVSIEYTGVLKDGKIDPESPSHTIVQGSHENYTFEKISENQTKLLVFQETNDDWSEYLNLAWPKALIKLKHICEG